MPKEMEELSLHILDIAMNSVKANALCIEIYVNEDLYGNTQCVSVCDDGTGMSAEKLAAVRRRLENIEDYNEDNGGIGLVSFKKAAENANGVFEISSVLGKGTKVKAKFDYSASIGVPLGSIEHTVIALIAAAPAADIIYKHTVHGREFVFSTKDVRKKLGCEVSIANSEVLMWALKYIKNGISEIREYNRE